ncbi:MAG: glycosyltransferase family 2 protein [Halobacteriota archaeon]
MYRGSRLGVVVPAYNEAGFVGRVIETMPEFVDRVYVVDDCSTDGTWEEIRRHAERVNERTAPPMEADGGTVAGGPVVSIRHEHNQGVGGAITTGYRRALADDMDVIAVMNGDAQMDPDRLDDLVDPVVDGRADYAKGNRLGRSADTEGMSRWRLFGNWLLTFLTKVASGYWKTVDPQNGYTAISREALETIGPSNFYRGYGFCNDVLVKLNAHEFTVANVSMPAVYGDEQSSIRYSSFVPKLSTLLLRGFLWRLRVRYLVRDFHPLAFFYLFGAVATVVGVALAVGSTLTRTPGGVAGLAIVALGWLSILFGMTHDVEQNEPLEVAVR